MRRAERWVLTQGGREGALKLPSKRVASRWAIAARARRARAFPRCVSSLTQPKRTLTPIRPVCHGPHFTPHTSARFVLSREIDELLGAMQQQALDLAFGARPSGGVGGGGESSAEARAACAANPPGATPYPAGATPYPPGATPYPPGATPHPPGGTPYPPGGTSSGGPSHGESGVWEEVVGTMAQLEAENLELREHNAVLREALGT